MAELKSKNCTACTACLNICPKGAIYMEEDEHGFAYPKINADLCINCGLCEKTCSKIDNINKNKIIKSYAVQSKDFDLIKKSSSGGMFAELAKYVLSQGGVVFGCTLEKQSDKFEPEHIYIEDEKDLYKLQGSKYVQSTMGTVLNDVKNFLNQNRPVLFSGTPCQIAGLRTFLNKDYDNLICVDLSCEGVPNKKFFNDYVKFLEQKIKAPITDFKFRSKKHFGWSTTGFVVTYKKGNKSKELKLPQNLSSYFSLFLDAAVLRESCYECKFVGTQRVGDITIADAWEIELEYPDLLSGKQGFNKNKGISLVTCNTEKGRILFDKLSANYKTAVVNIDKLKKHNHPFVRPSGRNKDRELYFDIWKNSGYQELDKYFIRSLGLKRIYYIIKNHTPNFIKNLIKEIKYKKSKTDCLLFTAYFLPNYGSILTAYALQKAIENLGYTSKIIHYSKLFGFGKSFVKKQCKLTKMCANYRNLCKLNKTSDTFIMGSDSLLNLITDKFYNVGCALLNFTPPDKKRIMISGSMGNWDGTFENDKQKEYFGTLLNRFDYISTREEHGQKVFREIFEKGSDWINDPVFYLDKEDYADIAKNSKNDFSGKIMQYVLYPNNENMGIVDYYRKKYNKEVAKFAGNENTKFLSRNKYTSVEDWLSAIINSDIIITDSFHCVSFALMFNKKVVCVKNQNSPVRFTSLFKRLGVDIPLMSSAKDLDGYDFEYDKDKVNSSIKDIRDFANNKLAENLSKPKNNESAVPDITEMNKTFVKIYTPWYKRIGIFYTLFIIPIVIPVQRIIHNIRSTKF